MNKKIIAAYCAIMVVSSILITPLGNTAYAKSDIKKDYIIVAQNNKDAKLIESEYRGMFNKQNKNTGLLKNENFIISKMTDYEASEIEKDKRVVTVEPDVVVSALKDGDNNSFVKEECDYDKEWNLKSIHVDGEGEKISNKKIKVALLDSGVDYQNDLKVKERVNLVDEIDNINDISPMFEDCTNHGTSIASLIVSTNGKITGINKNVELYSAKILDDKNEAPISRVIEGIYWAIDKDVNIISISFGTNQYSEALKKAVDYANDKGILIIAAAGNQGENGNDTIEYPAAFDNVLAVGSVNSKSEISEFSSRGNEVDVVAPGEAIRATGAFGEVMLTSGTSMAVPHVVGVVSLLWQKDITKSKDFIRELIEKSARNLGNEEIYGKGIIDYQYAEKMYDKAEEQYNKNNKIKIEKNTSIIQHYDNSKDEEKVSGTWSGSSHQKYLTDNGINLPAMKKGAIYPDNKNSDGVEIYGMTENPDFHGLYERRNSNNEYVNYLASYRFMIKIGNVYGSGKTYTEITKESIPGLQDESWNRIRTAMSKIQAKSFFKNYSNSEKKAFIYGIAMHTATDVFAHSTYRLYNGKWYSITHAQNEEKGQMVEGEADNTSFVPERFNMAYMVEKNTLYRYQGKRTEVAVCHDFHIDNSPEFYPANPTFKVKRLSEYGTQVLLKDVNVISHFATINYN